MISLAFLIFTALFLLAASAAGFSRLWVFVDLQSLIFILSGVAGYFLLFGRKEFGRGVKTFFAFSFSPDDHASESGRFFLRLAEFTLAWGLFGVLIALLLIASSFNPDFLGQALAVGVLSFLYASGLSLFVFLPIGLRLSPPKLDATVLRRLLIRLSLFALVGFVFLRCLPVIVIFSASQLSAQLPPYEFATAVQHAAFAFNPADPITPAAYYSPFHHPPAIFLYIDAASAILMVAVWWLFRMAAGKQRKWIAAPVVILIGMFWSIVGLILMFSDLNPQTIGSGFMVAMLTTLYGFFAAIGFLMVDMLRSDSGDYGVPASPALSGEMEQAKEIIDKVVEKERR